MIGWKILDDRYIAFRVRTVGEPERYFRIRPDGSDRAPISEEEWSRRPEGDNAHYERLRDAGYAGYKAAPLGSSYLVGTRTKNIKPKLVVYDIKQGFAWTEPASHDIAGYTIWPADGVVLGVPLRVPGARQRQAFALDPRRGALMCATQSPLAKHGFGTLTVSGDKLMALTGHRDSIEVHLADLVTSEDYLLGALTDAQVTVRALRGARFLLIARDHGMVHTFRVDANKLDVERVADPFRDMSKSLSVTVAPDERVALVGRHLMPL